MTDTKMIAASAMQRAKDVLADAGYSLDNTPGECLMDACAMVTAFNAIVGDIRRGPESWETIGGVLREVTESHAGFYDLLGRAVKAAALGNDPEMDTAIQAASDLLREAGEARATGQVESLRRHKEAIAVLRRAVRLSREHGDGTISADALDQITDFDDPHSLPEPECVVVRIAEGGSFVTEVHMGDGTKKCVPIDWTGTVSEDKDYGEPLNTIMGRRPTEGGDS